MKLTKKAQLLLVATVLPLLLAGCTVQFNENKEPIGWLYNYLVVPTQWLLNQIASVFNGNYAIAIVIVSILVRVLLMPTQFHQMKAMLVQQEKMAVLKPARTPHTPPKANKSPIKKRIRFAKNFPKKPN